jgi:hypothetical protein
MRRLFSFITAVLVTLALPALAQARTGTVLSLSQQRHVVQIVAANKVVHAYGFTGHLHGVRHGTELSFAASGSRITHAHSVGISRSFSFLATVVRSTSGTLVLSLGDAHHLRLTGKQLSATKPRVGDRPAMRSHGVSARASTGNATINISGLQAGQTVVVTESTDTSGNVTITITLPSGDGSGTDMTATGLVNNIGTDTFDIITSDDSDLNFDMDAADLANVGMSSCDEVIVKYHVDDQMMIADTVTDDGPPNSGPCMDGGDGDGDVIGTVTALSATSITVDAGAANGGIQTFGVSDPSVTEGFIVGDSVDVTYEQDGPDFYADDVEYNDTPTSGVVQAIATSAAGFETITLIDDSSDQYETFFVPDDLIYGQGIQLGDDVSVSYYQAASGLTLDSLDDNGPA